MHYKKKVAFFTNLLFSMPKSEGDCVKNECARAKKLEGFRVKDLKLVFFLF